MKNKITYKIYIKIKPKFIKPSLKTLAWGGGFWIDKYLSGFTRLARDMVLIRFTYLF